MLKSKYATLSKEEKIKAKEEFYQTEFGKNLKIRLDRLFLIGIAGLLFSMVMFAMHGTPRKGSSGFFFSYILIWMRN